MISDFMGENENFGRHNVPNEATYDDVKFDSESDQKLAGPLEVIQQIRSILEKDETENILGDVESQSINISIVPLTSGTTVTKSAISTVKAPKARRKMVSFSANDQFYATEYQEPYINEGDVFDDHQQIDLASMISGEDVSSSQCSFAALDKATAGSAFDSASFDDLPLRLSLVESEGPERFSMDQVIQKLMNLQFAFQPSESVATISNCESREEEDVSLKRNSLLNSKSTTATMANNYHIPDLPPRDDCVMTTTELMLAASKTLMCQYQLQSAKLLDDEVTSNFEDSRKLNVESVSTPLIVSDAMCNDIVRSYSGVSSGDQGTRNIPHTIPITGPDNDVLNKIPEKFEVLDLESHDAEFSLLSSPEGEDHLTSLDRIPKIVASRTSYIEDNEKLSISYVPHEESDLSPLMECSSSMPKTLDSVGSGSAETLSGTLSCTDTQCTLQNNRRKYQTHKTRLFQDKNRFSEDYRGNMHNEIIQMNATIDRQEIPILRDRQEEKTSNHASDVFVKRSHSRISKKNYGPRVICKRKNNDDDDEDDDLSPTKSGERKVSSYHNQEMIIEKEKSKIVACSIIEAIKLKTKIITKKISKIANSKRNKDSSCATTNPCDSRRPSLGGNNTTLVLPLSPDCDANSLRIKPRSQSILIIPQVAPLSASQFRRHERLNRHESVALDMGKGIERYKKWKLFRNIFLLWLIIPVLLCFLFYGIIPYDQKNVNRREDISFQSANLPQRSLTTLKSSSVVSPGSSSSSSSLLSSFVTSSTTSTSSSIAYSLTYIDGNMKTPLQYESRHHKLFENHQGNDNNGNNNGNNNYIKDMHKKDKNIENNRELSDTKLIGGKIDASVWSLSLIPWILIMTTFASITVEIYSSVISEIEFSVVVWEDTPKLFFYTSMVAIISGASMQLLIFSVFGIGHLRSWLAIITGGFISIASVLFRTFYYRKVSSTTLKISPESQQIFSQFLKGIFVLIVGSSVLYTVFITFYTQFGGFKGGFIGYVAASMFPFIRILILYVIHRIHCLRWGCARGNLCAGNTITVITSLWHGVFFSLACACVSTMFELMLTVCMEIGLQAYVVYKIIALPGNEDENYDDSNRTMSSRYQNQSLYQVRSECDDHTQATPKSQSQASKLYKIPPNRTIAIHNSCNVEDQSSSRRQHPAFQDENNSTFSRAENNRRSEDSKTGSEYYASGDIRRNYGMNKQPQPSLATMSNSSRFGNDGNNITNNASSSGIDVEAGRMNVDENGQRERVKEGRAIRLRTPDDDIIELRLATWLGMTWVTGILTPIAFLFCCTLFSCGPNRDLFGPSVSVFRHNSASGNGPLFNTKSDIEIIGLYNRMWSLNVFKMSSDEDMKNRYFDSPNLWLSSTLSLQPGLNELVGKLLAISFVHILTFISGSFWLKYGSNGDVMRQYTQSGSGSKTRNDFTDSENNHRPSKDIFGLMNALLEYSFNTIALGAILTMAIVLSIVFPWYGMNSSF